MTTRKENTATVNFPPAAVHAALTNREYWEYNVANLSSEAGEVHSFEEVDGGVEIVLYEVMPTDLLPEAVRAMISQALKIKRTVKIGPLNGTEAEGRYVADVKGAPVDFAGDLKLTGDDATATMHYNHEINVTVPFMGPAIEPKVADAVAELTVTEAELTEKWISENN
ncbi:MULTISPECIES: DUF2505 domain-containing protein [unclassified Corynebacterium]|uniref:DUF2505 domain-containing protein n=1 Tax=unclassified Corynebacterium TaxID=2624378 RepID=UPI00352557AA